MNTPYVPLMVSSMPKSLASMWGLLAVMVAGLCLLVDARLSTTSPLQAGGGVVLAIVGGLSWACLVVRRWFQHAKVLNLLVENELVDLLNNPKSVGLSRARLRNTLTRRYPGWLERTKRRHVLEESF